MNTQEILQKSQRILVQLPQGAEQKEIQVASTIICGLRELGKDVHLEWKPRAATVSRPASDSQNFVVSLKGLAPRISKVQYEKDKEDLRLYFTLQRGQVSEENLSLQIQNQSDLTIIVGDQKEQNNSWQTAVLELLALRRGSGAQLLGKVLRSLEYRGNIYASSIRQKDFQETNSTPKTLVQTASTIKEDFGSQLSYLFTFETADSGKTQALLWTSQESIKARLLPIGIAQQKGGWTLYTTQSSPQQLRHATLI
jgi:hypothetical protein